MKPIRQLLGYTDGLGKLFTFIALGSVVGAGLTLVTPVILKFATDWAVAVAGGDEPFTLQPLVVAVGALIASAVISSIVSDSSGVAGDLMAIRVRRQLSGKYFSHLLTLPQAYYDNEVTGTIINRLSRAISEVTQFMQFFSNNLLQMLLTVLVTIAALAWYSWPLAVLFVLLIPMSLYITMLTSPRWQRYETRKNKHFDRASGRFAEVVGQMRVVKSFGAQPRELKIFDDDLYSMSQIVKPQSMWWHGMNSLRTITLGVIFALIYGVLFYQTAVGTWTLGDLVLLLALVQQNAFPARNLSFFVDFYQRAVSNSRDYLEAMAEPPETNETTTSQLSVNRASVEFENISFGYTEKQAVLSGISFVIEPGRKLALVGESGGGKTTIANLLMRLYEPDEGQIKVDGTDISTVTRQSLRASTATVFQDAALFSGTIRENIAYANPDASDEQIEAAAKAANAYEFVSDFPDGFESEIGERGIKLSGGQKQRIAIARAILKDAPILILDEATSALDSRAERDVQQALNRLMKGRTTLIIAHRLSTIAHVDTIVTIKDGRIDEIGTPNELAKTGGIYAKLLELQLGGNETTKEQLAKYDIAS